MYIKLRNGNPEKYSIEQLRCDNPNTSFPKVPSDALLAEWNIYPFVVVEQPTHDYLTQTVTEAALTETNGIWTQGWIITNLPVERAENNIRSQRNNLLSQTDWMALRDNTMSLEWSAYRQALRDITTQEGFPESVSWPVKPE